ELTANGLNTFSILVGEIDPDSLDLMAITSKLEVRVNLLTEKITEFRSEGIEESIISVLEKARTDLNNLITKIENRNAKLPNVLAQYDVPLKVDNKVSSSRYYTTQVGGFRIEFLSDIGNLIEGDYPKIKT